MLVISLIVLALASVSGACVVDDDCSLNGVCQNGMCECDAAWSGDDCGVLQLLPTPRKSGYRNQSASSWGGSIMKVNDEYHMLASEFASGCGLNDWSPNSRVIHAISDSESPLGPYTQVGEALPTFHHNPQIRQASDGTYLLYVIGRSCNKTIDCSLGPQPPPSIAPCPLPDDPTKDNMESGLSLFVSHSIDGPWINVRTDNLPVLGNAPHQEWDYDTTNPAPFVFKNDSVLLMYRGCGADCSGGERIGLSFASHYSTPNYLRLTSSAPLCAREDGTCDNEDPFVWQDKRGYMHALLHYLGPDGGFSCSNSSGKWSGCSVGSHAFSRDGRSWTFSRTVTFNTTVCWIDEDITCEVLARRERPQLVLIDGEPAFLTNGASSAAPPPLSQGPFTANNLDDRSFTLIVPINRG